MEVKDPDFNVFFMSLNFVVHWLKGKITKCFFCFFIFYSFLFGGIYFGYGETCQLQNLENFEILNINTIMDQAF